MRNGIVIVLVAAVEFYLPDSQSLKNKRQVLKSLKDRLHNRFNVSVAEVDFNQLWQRSAVALAVVSNSSDHANEVLLKAIDLVEGETRLQVLNVNVEER